MVWKGARRKQKHVDPNILAVPGKAVRDGPHSGGHAAQTEFVDRMAKFVPPCPPFHLDEGHRPAAPGDKVHFPARRLHPLRKDAPAMQAEPPGSAAFPAPAPQPPKGFTWTADAKSLAFARELQDRFNLSNEGEALRMLITLGIERARDLFP